MVSLVPRGPWRQVDAQSPGSPNPGKVYEGAGLPFLCCPQARPLGVHNMFCPLCPGTRAQSPSWSKFGRGREGWGGDRMSLSCHTHPCPRPRKREGQKAWKESETKTGERRRDTGESRPEWGTECGHPERQTDRQRPQWEERGDRSEGPGTNRQAGRPTLRPGS